MNKSKSSRHFNKCNLKQIDIVTSFRKWDSSEKEKEVKKVQLYSTVIEIEDSDSELATENTMVEVLPKRKRSLICPFSDDEEEINGNSDETSLKQLNNTDKNEPSNFSTSPMACSTPVPRSYLNTSHNCPDISYTGINDISQISEEINDENSTSSTDSEKTIVLEGNSQFSKNKTLQVLQQVIIVPPKLQSSDAGTSRAKLPAQSPVKRNSTETEGKAKKLKKVEINNNSNGPLTEVQQNKNSLENPKLSKTVSSTEKQIFCASNGKSLTTETYSYGILHKNKNTKVETSLNTIQKSKQHYETVVKAKKEEKKMNLSPLILLTELFNSVFSSKHVNNLLLNERKIIKKFLKMDNKYQYLCLKLITWKKEWYNVFKFCQRIHLDMEETDIYDMFTVLKDNGFVDTDYLDSADVLHLLNRLDVADLKTICNKFKLKKTAIRKEEMVLNLLKYCKTQSTLTIHKSARDLLIDEIKCKMGMCMRVNEEFQNAFYTTYVLGTFTNSRFVTMADYFTCMLLHKVVFPHYPIDDYTIFNSRTDFVSYAKAKKYRDKIEEISNHLECLQICKTVFNELKDLNNSRTDDELFKNAPHLRRYTAKAMYVSTLSFGVKNLFAKFPYDVKEWLEYMIEKINYPRLIGFWYYHLIWLYMKYLKPFNYDHATDLLVEVLEKKRNHLSDIQLYQLRKRGEQLMATKKYKIHQLHHDSIARVLPKPIEAHKFPEITVDAKTIRSNDIGKKRNYVVRDNDGNKNILKVEDVALQHYLEELGYTEGDHCEGSLMVATFTLFFYDIIYSSKCSIPGAFVSKIQSEPLDMNTEYFYPNRKEEIDSRLKEIECEWPDGKVISFLKDSYEKHSHEFTLCDVGDIIRNPQLLKVLVECIGRVVLAKIFQRLVTNFGTYRSGLPDLLVWNKDTKKCKFVEVKGENDRLSVGQTLWLNYLHSVGASIEVCHVHSIGSKRKIKKIEKYKDISEASTSSTPD